MNQLICLHERGPKDDFVVRNLPLVVFVLDGAEDDEEVKEKTRQQKKQQQQEEIEGNEVLLQICEHGVLVGCVCVVQQDLDGIERRRPEGGGEDHVGRGRTRDVGEGRNGKEGWPGRMDCAGVFSSPGDFAIRQ
ncbi:hypothetical protein R1sor_014106 [Riccia sorocarpa]|uniref:Uncharacterized protein n=1 Tax=Riccia sorocarpa TaxID=122646 RepID=A0ABD3H8F8_9MARC